jgi:hypothetical protein
VRDSGGTLLSGASVNVTRTGYNETETTSSCGQAFFPGLSETTYDILVSKAGYQDSMTAGFNISKDTRLSVVLQPL